jgi:hypothetical protein
MRQEEARLNARTGCSCLERVAGRSCRSSMGWPTGCASESERLKPAEPTGKGLIVLRDALIDAAMADEGLELQSGRGRSSRDLEASYLEGRLAADRVPLNRGLAGEPSIAGLIG